MVTSDQQNQHLYNSLKFSILTEKCINQLYFGWFEQVGPCEQVGSENVSSIGIVL